MSAPQLSSLQEAPSNSGGKVELRSNRTRVVISKPSDEAREMVAAATAARWQAPAVPQQTKKRNKNNKKSTRMAFQPSNTLHQGSRPPAARSISGGGKRAKNMVAAAAASTPIAVAGGGLRRGAMSSGQLTRSPFFAHRTEEEEVCEEGRGGFTQNASREPHTPQKLRRCTPSIA